MFNKFLVLWSLAVGFSLGAGLGMLQALTMPLGPGDQFAAGHMTSDLGEQQAEEKGSS